MVMPSWDAASINETFSRARSVMRAAPEPSAARGSTCVRRTEMTANSAPTKNALPSSRATATSRATWSDIGVLLVVRLHDRQQDAVDAPSVEVAHGQQRGDGR